VLDAVATRIPRFAIDRHWLGVMRVSCSLVERK